MKTVKSSVKIFSLLVKAIEKEGVEVHDASHFDVDYPFIKSKFTVNGVDISLSPMMGGDSEGVVSLDLDFDSSTVIFNRVTQEQALGIVSNPPKFAFSKGNKYDAVFSYKGNKFSIVPQRFGAGGVGIILDLYLIDGMKKTFITHIGTVNTDDNGRTADTVCQTKYEETNLSMLRGEAVKYVDTYIEMLSKI